MIIEAREDTIILRGNVKTNLWPAIQAAAALLLENYPKGIIIDTSGVTSCTAKGAETFADAFKYITSHDAHIVVAGLSPELQEISKTVQAVRSQLPLASTVEEARASIELEELTLKRGRARLAAVVPMIGNWRRAVYFGDKLAVGENCELHLIDLIKVPLTLPMGTPLPERETNGQARLEEAKTLVREAGLKSFSHVERVRSHSTGLSDFVKRLDADIAVVSIDCKDQAVPCIEEPKAMTLIEAADFELSLLKGSPEDPKKPIMRPVVPAVGAWGHALEHTCKLASSENSEITAVYLITVPRSEPINAPKPDADAAASDFTREALRIGKKYGMRVNPVVERMRDPVLGFLKMFETHEFDLAVVGVERETDPDYHIARAIATTLLQELPCETVFLKAVVPT